MEGLLLGLDVLFMIVLLFSVIRKHKGASTNLGFFAFFDERKK
jgi:hypothetical protein